MEARKTCHRIRVSLIHVENWARWLSGLELWTGYVNEMPMGTLGHAFDEPVSHLSSRIFENNVSL